MKTLTLISIVILTTSFVQAAPKKKSRPVSAPAPRAQDQPVINVAPPPPEVSRDVGPADIDHRWSDLKSPWDFSAQIGIFNPGVGFGVLGAKRVQNSILPRIDDSLSIEAGLSYLSISDTLDGISVSYTAYELSGFGRWDFRFQRFIFAARGGLTFLSGGRVTAQGRDLATRGGRLYIELGPSFFYELTNQLYLRANLLLGGYSQLTVGVTYFL